MYKPRLLILTNSPNRDFHRGQINGYELLIATKELSSVRFVSHQERGNNRSPFERVFEAVKRNDYDVLIVWTPGKFPSSESEFSRLVEAVNGRPILYWEGDAWGKENRWKEMPIQMSWWMSHSEIVFSTVSDPQVSFFVKNGAKYVLHTPNTYCHFYFRKEEQEIPKKIQDVATYDISMISNNTALIPGLSGAPGAIKRWNLAYRLHFGSGFSSRLFGEHWPNNWSSGYLDYGNQAAEIRKSKVNVNWDNFSDYSDYTSDRTPIALIAGRPHVTCRHSGMKWAPSSDFGLFQETSPKLVLERAKELLSMDPDLVWNLGVNAHNWAKGRISHRESARYVVSSFFDHIKKPPKDPWSNLPGPWAN
jgi:hypothetical protein